jgi:L-lactate dehydrogenase
MMVDPGALGGSENFMAEATWLARACRQAKPLEPSQPVRLPGEAALARKQRYLAEGVVLEPEILPALNEWALKLSVPLPAPLKA